MEKQKLNINVNQDKATGVFANLTLIAHTPTEFIIDFAQIMPGINQANVVSRVIVTPDQIKKILMAMQTNIAQYEKTYGEIETPTPNNTPTPGSTIPFSFPSGQA